MKKREWDKDIFNYGKAREWLGKNHLPVLFFLAILAIPILFMLVRFAVTHLPSFPDAAIADKVNDNARDFVTPALYYFSSIAQTMGAIIGLALAAMYAIMPNIRSSKDNPAFEPARRLLQRDEYFRRSINVGSVCILVSLLGLLFIYVTASSQSWAFVLLLFLGVTALGLGVYSLGTMFYFIRERMPNYFSFSEIPLLAVGNYADEIRVKNVYDALNFAELCILIEAMGIKPPYMYQSLPIIKYASEKFVLNQASKDNQFEFLVSQLMRLISFDIEKTVNFDNDKRKLNGLISKAIWNSLVMNPKLLPKGFDNEIKLIKFIIKIINKKLSFIIQEDSEVGLFNIIINDYFHINHSRLTLYTCNDLLNMLYNIININYNIYDIFFEQPHSINGKWRPLETNLTIYLLIIASNIELNINILDKILDIYYKSSINILRKISHLISLKESYESYIKKLENNISYAHIISEIEYDKYYPYHYVSLDNNIYIDVFRFLLDFKPKGDSIVSDDNSTIRRYLNLFDYKLASEVYSSIKYKKPKLRDFVYTVFIPYLKDHGIDVEGNPEYLAIIRRRIKEIKEPELDF